MTSLHSCVFHYIGWIVSGGVALLNAGHKTGLMCTTVYL
jgi:hypothetical protein